MYLLMQSGSKPGILQSSAPWNNTVLSVPIHRNAYTIFTSKFQNFADLSHVQLFNWTFRTKPLGLHELLLLVFSFRLTPKSRNFVAATLFMFLRWAVPAVMMSSAFQTFRWLLHLYPLNFIWVFMPGTFLNGFLWWMSHDWSTFLAFTDFPRRIFTPFCKPIESCKIWWFISFCLFSILEHLPKILLGLGNNLK